MRRLLLGAAVLAAFASLSSPSAAERAQVTLTYVQSNEVARVCPDEPTFRGLVSSRLGYDPFTTGGTTKLAVSFQSRGAYVVGQLGLTGAEGKDCARTMRAPSNDCFELATSMALAVAVAIDPDAVRANGAGVVEPPVALTPPPAPPAPAPPPPPEPAPKEEEKDAAALRVDLGALAPWGIVPAMRGGVRVGAAFDAAFWSIGAEGAFLFAGSETSAFGEVSAYALYGSLVPCAHPALGAHVWIDLCLVGSVGALRSDASHVERAAPTTDILATVAPRSGVTVLPWSHVGFALAVDVPFALSRITLAIEDSGVRRKVWTSPLVGLVVGLSLVLRFD